jgi:hypothetical protein
VVCFFLLTLANLYYQWVHTAKILCCPLGHPVQSQRWRKLAPNCNHSKHQRVPRNKTEVKTMYVCDECDWNCCQACSDKIMANYAAAKRGCCGSRSEEMRRGAWAKVSRRMTRNASISVVRAASPPVLTRMSKMASLGENGLLDRRLPNRRLEGEPLEHEGRLPATEECPPAKPIPFVLAPEGIPALGAVPLLGALFGYQDDSDAGIFDPELSEDCVSPRLSQPEAAAEEEIFSAIHLQLITPRARGTLLLFIS